ncbi:MAG: flagellar basal body rod protein FlgG, partial [gamma proteobacterium symbiont of Ctena orbiculata]
MYPALWIAKTGLDAQQTNMAVISNNLSNVNTTGYKRDRAVFNDLIYQNIRQVGAQSSENTELPSGLMVGTGVRVVATQKEHSQGNIVQTGNSLDVAIQGKGYFQVLHPDGNIVYSRDGTFSLTADGNIVTPNGYELQPAMTVPTNATSLTIGSDGVVSVL